jgi:hypothetical protein
MTFFNCLEIINTWNADINAIYFFIFFQNRELQIMRKLEHQNIVKLKYFFYSAGEKVSSLFLSEIGNLYYGELISLCWMLNWIISFGKIKLDWRSCQIKLTSVRQTFNRSCTDGRQSFPRFVRHVAMSSKRLFITGLNDQ